MTFILFIDNNGESVVNTFPVAFDHDSTVNLEQFKRSKLKVNGESVSIRYACIKTEEGSLSIITSEREYLNRMKSFKEFCKTYTTLIPTLIETKNEIERRNNQQVEELIHNITSIHTHTIQNLFALVPQIVLTDNTNSQKEKIKEIIKSKPTVTTETISELIRYSLAQQIEFSVFEKTINNKSLTQKITTPIRTVVISTLQIFLKDFESKGIEISVPQCDKEIYVDIDEISVAIFYLLENAFKYTIPYSKFKIFFEKNENDFDVKFDMLSLGIEQSQVKSICNYEYRSPNARRFNPKGKGIGMYKLKKLLDLNDAEIVITARKSSLSRSHKGELFEHNQFVIKFKKQGGWM